MVGVLSMLSGDPARAMPDEMLAMTAKQRELDRMVVFIGYTESFFVDEEI
jgi:hypothetical protein